jgi:O-antigen ligase
MIQSEAIHSPAFTRPLLKTLLPVAGVAGLVTFVFGFGPDWLVSDVTLKTMAAVSMLLVPLCVILAIAKARGVNPQRTTFALSLLIWWFLLISDELFDRISDVRNTYEGQFSVSAYAEVVTWLVAFLILIFISLTKPEYLANLFSGSYKWLSLFMVSCFAAALYSPSPSYALGWWFKLFLVTLVLGLCTSCIERFSDVRALLWCNLWGLLFICGLALADAFADPTTLFQGMGGRLNADPVVLSGTAGFLLIVTLVLHSLRSRLWLKLVGLISVVIMIFAFGKTGLIAGAVSATAFFVLQKKIASGLGLLLGVVLLGALLVATVTPLANYLTTYKGGSTLTGRTEIWGAALPGIKQHPIIGHGYLASKFMWTTRRGSFEEVAPHLHNGFMEALYNNGLIGLMFLVGIHGSILTNLFRARKALSAQIGKAPAELEQTNILIVGCFALYLNLLIYGCFTPAFGGRTTAHFMIFLSILGLSIGLRKLTHQPEEKQVAAGRTTIGWQKPFSEPSPSST